MTIKGFIRKFIILLSALILLTFNTVYLQAKKIAVEYLQIMTIRDEESYQKVKKSIYNISSDYVKTTLFQHDHYWGTHYPEIHYTVDKVRCIKIKSINHFIFEITFTVRGWGTVESLIYVNKGVVYDIHSKEQLEGE